MLFHRHFYCDSFTREEDRIQKPSLHPKNVWQFSVLIVFVLKWCYKDVHCLMTGAARGASFVSYRHNFLVIQALWVAYLFGRGLDVRFAVLAFRERFINLCVCLLPFWFRGWDVGFDCIDLFIYLSSSELFAAAAKVIYDGLNT